MDGNAPGQRSARYTFDGGDEDLKRLLSIADMTAEASATALRRSSIGPGWNVIECGCGPLGALHVLAELVGETGRVTGIDLNPDTAERARSVTGSLGLGNVHVFAGDVNDADPAALGGPFDLAFCRLFLLHQADPVQTLRRIAAMLRPGGWIIAQEPLRHPSPQAFPHCRELDTAWQLIFELAGKLGAQPHATEQLPRSAVSAGLELVRTDGVFILGNPASLFPVFASTLAATRESATAVRLATGEQIDALVAALNAAAHGDYEWVAPGFMLECTMRKPAE
jgi:SAM-dependent methyltransferase